MAQLVPWFLLVCWSPGPLENAVPLFEVLRPLVLSNALKQVEFLATDAENSQTILCCGVTNDNRDPCRRFGEIHRVSVTGDLLVIFAAAHNHLVLRKLPLDSRSLHGRVLARNRQQFPRPDQG